MMDTKIQFFKRSWDENYMNFIKHIKPNLVIQFGSSIKDSKKCEDIDLLIVSTLFEAMNELEIRNSVEQFFPNLTLDIWAFSDKNVVKQNPILVKIVNDGKVLYEYDGY